MSTEIDGFEIVTYTDIEEINNLIDNVINIVIKTYEPIGGYYGNTNTDRLKRTTSMVKAVYDSESNMIACSFYRNVDGSYKIQAYGNNQTDDGKNAVKAIIHSDVNGYSTWIWGEVSGGVERYFKKYAGYPLPNSYVCEVLQKPANQIRLSTDGFHYSRSIGNSKTATEKVIFGFKNREMFEKITKEADYEMFRAKFNTSLVIESEKPLLEIKSFRGACSFINQLSDLYDEENLRQLTPGLSAMLDQSIEILKDNIGAESWVARTLDDALYLRDNISSIEIFSAKI